MDVEINEQLMLILGTAWLVLTIVGRWLLFRKAGKPGIFSIIPVISIFTEYNICWTGWMVILSLLFAGVSSFCAQEGQNNTVMMIIAAVAGIGYFIILWTESQKLARSFGKGFIYGLLLFFFGRVFRVLLGLSAAEYRGKP